MSKKNKLIFFICLAFVLLVSVPSVFAYFSTFTETKGSKKIVIQNSTYLTEEVDSWTKRITIKADSGSDPVYVRAKVFKPDEISVVISGDGWSDGDDGYYYYGQAIDGKDGGNFNNETSVLNVLIEKDKLPVGVKEGDNFHIIVVYEAKPYVAGNSNDPDFWSNNTEGGNQ